MHEQIESLPLNIEASLARFLRTPESNLQLVGSDSVVALAALLSAPKIHLQSRPHLLIVARHDIALTLEKSLRFFDPQLSASILPPFDVGLYSNLYPHRKHVAARMAWLYRAQTAKPGDLFIASFEALLQKTLPFQLLHQNSLILRRGSLFNASLRTQLVHWGYTSTPLVEDVGTLAIRGGIVDIFSPIYNQPVRLELIGDAIETMRFIDIESQRSLSAVEELALFPVNEVLFSDDNRQRAAQLFKDSLQNRKVDTDEAGVVLQSLAQGQYFHGIEFLLPYFYDRLDQPLHHFSSPLTIWTLDPMDVTRTHDQFVENLRAELNTSQALVIRPEWTDLYASPNELAWPADSKHIAVTRVHVQESGSGDAAILPFPSSGLKEFVSQAKALAGHTADLGAYLAKKIREWRDNKHRVFICVGTQSQAQRLQFLLSQDDFQIELVGDESYAWSKLCSDQDQNQNLIHILPRSLTESLRLGDEQLVFLREEDIFASKRARRTREPAQTISERAHALSFGELKPGDFIVHTQHGIGVYEGLKVMPIQGIDAEFIQLKYRDNDKLYLPVYRVGQIQKYSGPTTPSLIDKLGGQNWEKTKTKVRAHLRDIAAELLNLYAKRSQMERPEFSPPNAEFMSFEAGFPYEETEDQNKAIQDVLNDLQGTKPMDRLVCGDVGFGKTEVALRAAFKAVLDKRQVAVIAPTTVLVFQHAETFRKRFASWPVEIRPLNRFVQNKQAKETLKGLRDGTVDIVIGTHRLLSRDIEFKDLGLLVIDEEQKFGVKHKERLRQLRTSVDTLAMSATPIPRTLNLSLMGVRDLSIINTPPVDRLPTRTFTCKFDPETIRKAIQSEISRGGQIFFIHNRIQSIYALADELRSIVPDVRMKVAHGQMPEDELEKTMLAFFQHEIDMLICTTIVESGMDIPNANTMFIDNAHQLGLSQLYQLRGRVGRSRERAYCYLLVPPSKQIDKDAQERLKVIQENSALGSGIRIAHYDLELRGTGDILGEDQSGHINAVGYELYLELLDDAVQQLKGGPITTRNLEPEINVRIPALIPDSYINDLRIRLAYYKAMSEIRSHDDVDRIEGELRDQFGKPPEPVLNLLGLMLIRKQCRDLEVRDLSASKVGIALAFTEHTKLSPQTVVDLASKANKKYAITPDNRLTIRIHELTWPRIYEELEYLLKLIKI